MLTLGFHTRITALVLSTALACSDDDAGSFGHDFKTGPRANSSGNSSALPADGGADGRAPNDAATGGGTNTADASLDGGPSASDLDASNDTEDGSVTPVDATVEDDRTVPLDALRVNSPRSLVTESDDDYDANESGIISGATLDRWIGSWVDNRPSGITGKLVILQQDSRAGTTAFIGHDDNEVFTYGFAEHAYADAQKRNNGLLDTFATIPDGARTDEILNQFNIDLTKDLVVFAFADKDAVPGAAVDSGAKATKVWYNTRSWWWLRYWGADASHLAILDGAAKDVLASNNLVSSPSPVPSRPGKFTVQSLRDDNTSLKVDVGELIELVRAGGSDLVLVDPRRKAEYFGEEFASPANPVNAERPLTEGRIKGARFLPWQATLAGVTVTGDPDYAVAGLDAAVSANSLRFKPKAELLQLYYADELVNYDAAPTGAITVHYCGHGRRATTWAFVSLGVLGMPARLYDGSWVEWGNLAGGEPLDAGPERPLPEVSPWRTDTTELAEHGSPSAPTPGVYYNPSSGVVSEVELTASASGLDIDPRATTTRLIADADKAYKH